jgi:hypothetical protein
MVTGRIGDWAAPAGRWIRTGMPNETCVVDWQD